MASESAAARGPVASGTAKSFLRVRGQPTL